MPRITDNVTGRSMAVKMGADNKGFVRAISFSTAVVNQYQPVPLVFDEGGWVFLASTAAALTAPGQRFMGIVQDAITAAEGTTGTPVVREVQLIGPSKCLSTIAHATGQAIVRTTGLTVDAVSGSDYTGGVGQWGVCMTTEAASTTPRNVWLTGTPVFFVTSTLAN